MLVSGVQQDDSVIHMSPIPFKFLFPFRLLQSTEQSPIVMQQVCVGFSFKYSNVYTAGTL